MPYYLYIHNIYLYQYHDTKPNSINIDWLLVLTPTDLACKFRKKTFPFQTNRTKKRSKQQYALGLRF